MAGFYDPAIFLSNLHMASVGFDFYKPYNLSGLFLFIFKQRGCTYG